MFKELNEQLQKFIETKPRRAWSGRLEQINKLINWMCDKNILTKTDQKKKESLFHKYYRYYNDGDFPRGVKDISYDKLDDYDFRFSSAKGYYQKRLEAGLEEQLEEFIKYVLSKYLPKVDRKEFHKDMAIEAYDDVLRQIRNKDPHALFYWVTKLPQDAQEQIDIAELKDLLAQYKEIAKDIPDEKSWGDLGGKVYSYGRDTVLDKRPESADIIAKIDKKLVDLDILVRNMKKAAIELWNIEEDNAQ